jgi:hypothetical protein
MRYMHALAWLPLVLCSCGGLKPSLVPPDLHPPCEANVAKKTGLCASRSLCPVVVDATLTCGRAGGLSLGVGRTGQGFVFVHAESGAPAEENQLFSIRDATVVAIDLQSVLAPSTRGEWDNPSRPPPPNHDASPSGAEIVCGGYPFHETRAQGMLGVATDADGKAHFLRTERGLARFFTQTDGGWSLEEIEEQSLDVVRAGRARSVLRRLFPSVARYLRGIGEPTDVPNRTPARGPPYWASRVLRRGAGSVEAAE